MSGPRSVVFYVSGHGFGHASREVEVINTLAVLRPDLQIVLRTAVSPTLLSRTLRTPVLHLEGPCDVGVIQNDSVTHDDSATVRAAVAFQSCMADRVAEECARLRALNVQTIVADIPPIAFEVAQQLGVPSIALSNFTWDWIYGGYTADFPTMAPVVDAISRSYQTATHALQLPMAGGFEVFPNVTALPFIARHAVHSRDETRQMIGLDPSSRVALLSFGGYGLQRLELSQLDCLDEWTLLLTDRIAPPPAAAAAHVKFLPESTFESGLRYEDLVAAVDVVVTKPGYGIVSECVAHQTPMLYTSRGAFREYDVMVAEMPTVLRCRFISQDDLFGGRWQDALSQLLRQPPPPMQAATDGAQQAARFIANVLDGCNAPASKSAGG